MSSGKWIVAVTGASGIKYSIRLLQVLADHRDIREVHVILSEAAHRVLQEEENIKLSFSSLNAKSLIGIETNKLNFFNPKDIAAPAASGSFLADGMVIVPCSMSTLASVAHGIQQNLIHRAADVTLKENRKLILVPRETPLSQIHLENMLKLSKIGVVMAAAMPGFYHRPSSLDELIDMQCMKILDCMQLDNSLVTRWGNEKRVVNLIKL
jgi:4-hydroxy-3-polyprenylbenzoate decarboxylase